MRVIGTKQSLCCTEGTLYVGPACVEIASYLAMTRLLSTYTFENPSIPKSA